MAPQQQYLRVSTADKQADEWELRPRFAPVDEVAQHVRLQVVHLDEGFSEGLAETLGKADAHHQRPHQSGASRERHSVDVGLPNARLADGTVHHGNDILLVRAARQLGNHTSILFVNFLTCNNIA